jgi:hypothetical protein
MAYLTCPLCNSQSFHEKDLPSRVGLLKFSCIGSDHTFYVDEEEINGKPEDTERG